MNSKMTEARANAKADRINKASEAAAKAIKDAMIESVEEDRNLDADEQIGAMITAMSMAYEAVLRTIAEPGVGNRKQANLACGLFQKIIAPEMVKVISMATDGNVKINIKEG